MFSKSKVDATPLEYIALQQEDIFTLWMLNNNDKKLNDLNLFCTLTRVNLLDFLLKNNALKAFDYAIERKILDIPGCNRLGLTTTALLERAKCLVSTIEHKETARENIRISKKLIDHDAHVNFAAPLSKVSLQRLSASKTSYTGLMGETVLMYYAMTGCTEMVTYALEHGGEASINVRSFSLIDLGAYASRETEAIVAPQITQTDEGYRFDTALSIAFASTQTNDGEIIKLLLDHGADLSIFHDDEFYRPILFAAVAKFDSTTGYIRPECRTKVEIILKKMEEENLHVTACKETYHIFSEMLSEQGYRYNKQRMCTLL